MNYTVEEMAQLIKFVSENAKERSVEMLLYKDLLNDAFKALYAKPYVKLYSKTLNYDYWHKKRPIDYERFNKKYTNYSVTGLLATLIKVPQKIIEENKLGKLYQDAIFALRDGMDAVNFLKPLL